MKLKRRRVYTSRTSSFRNFEEASDVVDSGLRRKVENDCMYIMHGARSLFIHVFACQVLKASLYTYTRTSVVCLGFIRSLILGNEGVPVFDFLEFREFSTTSRT